MKAAVLLVLSLAACNRSPAATVEKMRAFACSGDPDGFFSFVDSKAVAESAMAPLRVRYEEEKRASTPEARAMLARIADPLVAMAGQAVSKMMASWAQVIRANGRSSNLCQMAVESTARVGPGLAGVRVRFAHGSPVVFTMKQYDNGWILSGIAEESVSASRGAGAP